jgi:hypothetical protein
MLAVTLAHGASRAAYPTDLILQDRESRRIVTPRRQMVAAAKTLKSIKQPPGSGTADDKDDARLAAG